MAADLTPLSDADVKAALAGLVGWARDGDALVWARRFESFPAALAALVRIAFVAEAYGHHPEIGNVYDRVTLRLTTHDAGNRITAKDVALARAIAALDF